MKEENQNGGVPVETTVGPSTTSPQPQAASGLSVPVPNANAQRTIYIAGPMRGYPRYNFDAFHDAEAFLQFDWLVLSPARADESDGFDPGKEHAFSQADMMAFMRRDFEMIRTSNGRRICGPR